MGSEDISQDEEDGDRGEQHRHPLQTAAPGPPLVGADIGGSQAGHSTTRRHREGDLGPARLGAPPAAGAGASGGGNETVPVRRTYGSP